jgi:hypothetical protein
MPLPKYQLVDVEIKKALDQLDALLPKMTDAQKEKVKESK